MLAQQSTIKIGQSLSFIESKNLKETPVATTPDDAFQLFLKAYSPEQIKLLDKNKEAIFKQCHSHLSLDNNIKKYSEKDSRLVLQTLHKTVYSCAYIPAGLIRKGDKLESDQLNPDSQYKIDTAIPARNLLRHIVRGTEIHGSDERYHKGLDLVQHALENKKNEELLKDLRLEIKYIFKNIAERLVKKDDEKQNPEPVKAPANEKQYEILISNLLAAYPFVDPTNEPIEIPQKMPNGSWKNVIYDVKKIDISPQSGLLSMLLKDKDRIYAYGMTPRDNKEAQSQLLLMGTTYTTGQGARLSVLNNFRPRHSVGEGHDMTHLDKWVNTQEKIKVTGHSQGGTMAMIAAARHPSKITHADCLNPTALTNATLDSLNKKWLSTDKAKRPSIHVYAQQGDPVFPLENGFLEGTRLFRVIPGVNKKSNLKWFIPSFIQKATEAHLHHVAGYESSLILEMNAQKESFTSWREFRSDIKGALNWILYPFMYTDLATHLFVRNCKEWCLKHLPKPITMGATVIGYIPYYATKFLLDTVLVNAIKIPSLIAALVVTAFCSSASIGLKKCWTSIFGEQPSAATSQPNNNSPKKHLALTYAPHQTQTPSQKKDNAPIVPSNPSHQDTHTPSQVIAPRTP